MKTDKIKGEIPISNIFLSNMYAISKNRKVIHHSHVTSKIIGVLMIFATKDAEKTIIQYRFCTQSI